MSGNVKGRRYDASGRRRKAQETRARILAAAERRFTEAGYAAASIESIAALAGVSDETVYSSFRTKAGLLSALIDVALAGDQTDVPVTARPWVLEVRSEADQRVQMRLLARNARRVLERAGHIHHVIRTASSASPEIAELARKHRDDRLAAQTEFIRWVAAHGDLRDGIDTEAAGLTFWALASPDLHHLLTVQSGRSQDWYETWLGDALIAQLLPPGLSPSGSSGRR